MFTRISIIGLGLIGSSVARAAHAHKLAKTIIAYNRNPQALEYAKKQGFVDVTTSDLAEAVKNSDLIILATPPSTLGDIAATIAPHLKPGAIVMDVASVKVPAIAAIAPHIPAGVTFIPAHPIAGSEQTGVEAGRADLFEGKRIILCPEKPEMNEALKSAMDFWQGMGGRVEPMPADMHDMVYAYVSHLPQLLAFGMAGMLEPYRKNGSATFHKFIRLCGSSHALWDDIFLENKDNIINALDRYLDVISHVRNELLNAPEPATSQAEPAAIYTSLFPRLAASCLVTTVMEAEKNSGVPFARFAGTGFADFTFPATLPPDADIERISGQHLAVAEALNEFSEQLKKLRATI